MSDMVCKIDRKSAIYSLALTIVLAVIFTALQVFEYCNSTFTISDSVYGSTFYMATGFHGFHVFIGTCFLTVCLIRLIQYSISNHLEKRVSSSGLELETPRFENKIYFLAAVEFHQNAGISILLKITDAFTVRLATPFQKTTNASM